MNIVQYIQLAQEVISVYEELQKDGTIAAIVNALEASTAAYQKPQVKTTVDQLTTLLKGTK